MQSTELRLDISLADPEIRRTERHQFVNLIHVVHAELQLIERMSGRLDAFRESIRLCEAAVRAFGDRKIAIGYRDELIDFRDQIISRLMSLPDTSVGYTSVGYNAFDCSAASDIEDAKRVLHDVIDAADVRVQEVIARHEISRPWTEVAGDDLVGTSKSARGAYAGQAVRVPAGFGCSIARFLEVLRRDNAVTARIDVRDKDRLVVSIATPGKPLPGGEFTANRRIDYKLLREDAEGEKKLALLRIYFVVLPHGTVRLSSAEVPHDTILVEVFGGDTGCLT